MDDPLSQKLHYKFHSQNSDSRYATAGVRTADDDEDAKINAIEIYSERQKKVYIKKMYIKKLRLFLF